MDRVWYLAYGSNLRLARLRCYLAGGRPEGGLRDYPGCRDHADPLAIRAMEMPGGIYFAGRSSVWGGGMASYDPGRGGYVASRGYLLTLSQFSDVTAQEMRRPPGTDLDLTTIAAAHELPFGSGHYRRVLQVGTLAGLPMLTITSAAVGQVLEVTGPSAAYLWTMAAGLREAHAWDVRGIASYLFAIPGVTGNWRPRQLEVLAAMPSPPTGEGWRVQPVQQAAD